MQVSIRFNIVYQKATLDVSDLLDFIESIEDS